MKLAGSSHSVCLIIGDPVAHSLSPRMHNAGYRALDINFFMGAARIPADGLSEAIAGVKALGIRGLACTMPHKVAICPLLDDLDPVAETIGAVNTVVQEDGRLRGFNTDWIGILRPLESLVSLRGTKVAILGAGGAALAAIYACVSAGAVVSIFNRTLAKAAGTANRFGTELLPLSESSDLSPYRVIINTTSVGMSPQENLSPLTKQQVCPHHIVFETIYHPRETKLLQLASSCGATTLRGLDMFIEQGVAQFELHTGLKAPREAMRNEIYPPLVT